MIHQVSFKVFLSHILFCENARSCLFIQPGQYINAIVTPLKIAGEIHDDMSQNIPDRQNNQGVLSD